MTSVKRVEDLWTHASEFALVDGLSGGSPVSWTHRELLARAGALAAKIDEQPGSGAVLIDAPPSIDWILVALAGMMCRRPVVAFPESTLDAAIEEALPNLDLKIVYTHRPLQWAPVATSASIVDIGEADVGLALDISQRRPHFDIIAYTSGTSSSPYLKYFRMAPEATEVFAKEFCSRFHLAPRDRWSVCHSFSHIVHFEYVVTALLNGLDLHVLSVESLIRELPNVAPSALVTVPALYEQLARRLETAARKSVVGAAMLWLAVRLPLPILSSSRVRAVLHRALPGVRRASGGKFKVLIIGAASSPISLKRRLSALGLPLYEGYGLSEVGMAACQAPHDSLIGTVGRAWPGYALFMQVDGTLAIEPLVQRTNNYMGVAGEREPLLVDGVIRTGDLASIDAHGTVRIHGRRKSIIVTDRGKNINPVNIEARFLASSRVNAVVPVGDGRPFLTAVLFLSPGAKSITDAELAALNANAPEVERVRALIQTDVVPSVENGLLTRSGKMRIAEVIKRYERDIALAYSLQTSRGPRGANS